MSTLPRCRLVAGTETLYHLHMQSEVWLSAGLVRKEGRTDGSRIDPVDLTFKMRPLNNVRDTAEFCCRFSEKERSRDVSNQRKVSLKGFWWST